MKAFAVLCLQRGVNQYQSVLSPPPQLSNAINLKEIAEKSEGYSGSDLRELCRDAAMYRVRDFVRKEQMRQIAQQLGDSSEEEMYDSHPNTHKILSGNASTEHFCASLSHLPSAVWGEPGVGSQTTAGFWVFLSDMWMITSPFSHFSHAWSVRSSSLTSFSWTASCWQLTFYKELQLLISLSRHSAVAKRLLCPLWKEAFVLLKVFETSPAALWRRTFQPTSCSHWFQAALEGAQLIKALQFM